MELLIICLIIIIIILITYLFLLNKEIKNISKNLDKILNVNTNKLLNTNMSNKDVKSLVNKINHLVKYIKQKEININRKNDEIKKAITNITHDFRTPLTSSLGYLDMIQKSDIPKEEKLKDLEIIKTRLIRLSELINNFFEYSKTISKNENVELVTTNVVDILEERIAFFYDDFNNQNRKIEFESNENRILILSNKAMLVRIFDNLIGNALKHSKNDLKITIKNDKNLQIRFINEIDKTKIDIDKLFNEFYTSDISRTKENTGLGLAIVKEFTELLNGKISANIKNDEIIIELCFKPKTDTNKIYNT